jgi:hypothetical protein
MRQVGDMLVWLAMILVVAAVVYFTPQVADYVSSKELRSSSRSVTRHVSHHVEQPAEAEVY